ncbi:MAG: dihydroneopterin aldolase [Anaerolineaceae bacterium]|nr:dihydroneopterin aldolase [Anaerolineaceae bacterium]
MDKIIITDLKANGIIGVNHPERDVPRELLINVTLFFDTRKASVSDSIKDTINYSQVSKAIIAQVATTNFHTLEALSNYLAKYLLENYFVHAVKIRVEKSNIVSQTTLVGIEITRFQTDFES